jgi:hypothetical protein
MSFAFSVAYFYTHAMLLLAMIKINLAQVLSICQGLDMYKMALESMELSTVVLKLALNYYACFLLFFQ